MSSGPGQVVRFRRAQEAEAVGENLDDAFADDVDFLGRELLEDREHLLLLAHGRGVLDRVLFGEGKQFGGGFGLEVLEFHFPHAGGPESSPAADEESAAPREGREGVRRSGRG